MFLRIEATQDMRCRLVLNSQHKYREGGQTPDVAKPDKSPGSFFVGFHFGDYDVNQDLIRPWNSFSYVTLAP
jgi:hypothetical protein